MPAPPDLWRTPKPLVEMVNPVAWPAWDRFVSRHPGATVFHSAAWGRVLAETYGFTPTYLAKATDGEAVAGWPLTEIGGRFLRRGVSLPFTDSCPPLLEENPDPPAPCAEIGANGSRAPGPLETDAPFAAEPGSRESVDTLGSLDSRAVRADLLAAALALGRRRHWNSIELRDAPPWTDLAQVSVRYHGHTIDLSRGHKEALERCERSVQRAIRKAEGAGLRVVEARTETSVRDYFGLHCLTRKRHGLPPQPFEFFARIHRHLLEADRGSVILVLKDQTPIAGAMFLFWRNHALYKFGGSDEAFQSLRPNNLVFKEAIARFAARGCSILDLGRTSIDNSGLRRFKLGWGSVERLVSYVRYDLRRARVVPVSDRSHGLHTALFRRLPRRLALWIGRIGYRYGG